MQPLLMRTVFFWLLLLLQQVQGSPRGGRGGGGRGGGFRIRFGGGRGGFGHFQDNVTTPAQVVEGGVMVGRDIIEVGEDDHLSGRRCQACGLTQKSAEEIAVHQRVGGKALACYSLF